MELSRLKKSGVSYLAVMLVNAWPNQLVKDPYVPFSTYF